MNKVGIAAQLLHCRSCINQRISFFLLTIPHNEQLHPLAEPDNLVTASGAHSAVDTATPHSIHIIPSHFAGVYWLTLHSGKDVAILV